MRPTFILLRFATLCGLLAAAVTAPRAQQAERALADGRAAYRRMEYDTARVRLRHGLDLARATQVADSVVAAMHAYLGATAVQLGREAEAREEFVAAVSRRPDFRMDTLEFPANVSRLFDLARSTTAFVAVTTAQDTTLRLGADRQRFLLVASAPHEIRVDVIDSGGAVRRIYAGAIGERLEVFWDGLDAERGRPLLGAAELRIRATSGALRPAIVRLPLRVSAVGRPAGAPAARGGRAPLVVSARDARIDAFASALYVTAVAAVLPAVSSARERGSPVRFVVGGAALVAAIGALRRDPAPTERPMPAPTATVDRLRIESGPARRSEP